MNEKKEIRFSIENPRKEFEEHLNLPDNDRIILSAPFGAGKTYFLKEFFKEHPEYDVIHLYPVNYSVASNEDVFELIKYDILFELLRKEVDFEKVEFSSIDFLPHFIQDNKMAVLKAFTPLFSAIPKIGKGIAGTTDRMIDLVERFQEEHQNIQIDDEKSAIEYLKSFGGKTGGIYEDDFYTQLIRQLINQLQQKEDSKKTVLILDDLDRIDPEHIFRILNVLAAQIDKKGKDNKFDFDKIILVFDQDNVRNIFRTRYGSDVDYTGYIDKFYSYKIFEFLNPEGIKQKIRELLISLSITNKSIDFDITNANGNDIYIINGIVNIFERLIEVNSLTARKLLKISNADFNYQFEKIYIKDFNRELNERQFFILFVFRLLLFIYEDWELLENSINRLSALKKKDSSRTNFDLNAIIEECLLFLDITQHRLERDTEHVFEELENYPIKYKLHYINRERQYFVRIDQNIDSEGIVNEVLIKTMEKIKEHKILI